MRARGSKAAGVERVGLEHVRLERVRQRVRWLVVGLLVQLGASIFAVPAMSQESTGDAAPQVTPFDIDDLAWNGPDVELLDAWFERLGFTTLRDRVPAGPRS